MSKISCTILITRECPEFFSKSSVLSISQFGSDRNELRKRLVSGIRVCKYVFIRTHWAPLRVNIHASTNDIARSVGSSHLARNCVIAEINERIIKERIEKKRFEGERETDSDKIFNILRNLFFSLCSQRRDERWKIVSHATFRGNI